MSGLSFSDNYNARQEALRRSGVLTFVTWSDVTGTPLGWDDLRAVAASMPTEAVLNGVSALSIILTNLHWDPTVLQAHHRSLAQQICAPEIARRVDAFLAQRQRDVLAHEGQLLLAAKLAICYGQPGPAGPAPDDETMYAFGKLLLGINDVLQRGEAHPSPHDLLVSLALQRGALSRNEQLRYLLARYYDLLVTRARLQPNPVYDLDQHFQAQTGLGIGEYMALAFLYYTPFADVTTVQQLAEKGYQDIILRYERQMNNPELVERCRQLFTSDSARLRAAFPTDIQQLADASTLPFKHTPLIQTTNGSALPISLPFLIEKVAMSAYWELYNHFSAIDPGHGVNTFTSYLGEQLFQPYLTDLFARTYAEREGESFFGEQEIIAASPPHGDRPPFDAAIQSGPNLILIEMSARTIPVRAMERGDPVEFEHLIQRFTAKIRQLNRAFEALGRGIWRIPGVDLTQISTVYPVLALLHPFPQTISTWRPLRDAGLPRYRQIQGRRIMICEPQLLTAEECEMLEPLLHTGEYSLPALLQQKLNRPETASMSLKNFLLTTLQVEERPNEYLRGLFTTVANELGAILARVLGVTPE